MSCRSAENEGVKSYAASNDIPLRTGREVRAARQNNHQNVMGSGKNAEISLNVLLAIWTVPQMRHHNRY